MPAHSPNWPTGSATGSATVRELRWLITPSVPVALAGFALVPRSNGSCGSASNAPATSSSLGSVYTFAVQVWLTVTHRSLCGTERNTTTAEVCADCGAEGMHIDRPAASVGLVDHSLAGARMTSSPSVSARRTPCAVVGKIHPLTHRNVEERSICRRSVSREVNFVHYGRESSPLER